MNIHTVSFNNLTFLNINDLQELELKHLRQEYNFNHHHLDDFVNKDLVPKIEVTDEYTVIVLDFPYSDDPNGKEKKAEEKHEEKTKEEKKSPLSHVPTPSVPLPHFTLGQLKKKRLRVGHVMFFIGKDYLVVLHDERTPLINSIFEECQSTLKKREDLMGNGSQQLFYRIVDLLVDESILVANDISKTIDMIDKHLLEGSNAEKIVEDISITRRNIVVFQTMIKPALTIFSEIENGKYETLNRALAVSWGNIRDHLQRIWYRLEDNRELIEGIATSHESLLTARTNEIVKVLTMFTAVLLPLTLVASIYGMNIVGLPYAQQQDALIIVGLIMLILALGMILIFKIKNWL